MNAHEKIRQLLDSRKIVYEVKEHEPVLTSEQAARVRGDDIRIGAKAMILKADAKFVMCVLSAALKIDSKRVKELLGAKSLRFATPEEVKELTGCLPGGVPPFPTIFDLDYLFDRSVTHNEYMAFNAGLRDKSIKMKTEDYMKVTLPKVNDFSV